MSSSNAFSSREYISQLLCRMCSSTDRQSLEFSGKVTQTLLDSAHREGMAPCLYGLLHKVDGIPGVFRERLRSLAIDSEALEMQRRPALAELCDAFADSNIPVLLLKGAGLAYTLYPSPGQRPRSDTDILIPESSITQARTLLNLIGFKVLDPTGTTTLSFQFDAIRQLPGGVPDAVDVHYRVSNRMAFAKHFTFVELMQRSQQIVAICPAARGLSHPDALLVACFHRIGHLNEGQDDRLIWLYDIHLLVERLTSDEILLFTRLAREKGLVAVCKDGIEKASECFGTKIPPEINAVIQHPPQNEHPAALLHAGPMATLWHQFRAQEGWRSRLLFLEELVFPPGEYMRRKYPRSRSWLPLLYIRRGVEGVKKRVLKKKNQNSI